MKTCRTCGIAKILSDFYPHKAMADGYLNNCKECVKTRVRGHYVATFDDRRVYEHRRASEPHRKLLNTAVTKRMRERFPKKYKAHTAVSNALRSGKLSREPCQRCGSMRVHGHHEDYARPLDVMWLCAKHHKERHRELDAAGIVLL